MVAKRKCSRCGKPNAVPPARLCPTCKRKARQQAQEKARNNRAQSVYKLRDGDYQKLYDHSKGKCYICGGRGGGKLNIDHNHETGEVRGLLCTKCNYILLGRIGKDNPDILEAIMSSAVDYLRNPPSRKII